MNKIIDKTIRTVKDLTIFKDLSSSFIKKCNPLVSDNKMIIRSKRTINLYIDANSKKPPMDNNVF